MSGRLPPIRCSVCGAVAGQKTMRYLPREHVVAEVFRAVCRNADRKGTFRQLLTELGLGAADYELLYKAGGMRVSNAMVGEEVEV